MHENLVYTESNVNKIKLLYNESSALANAILMCVCIFKYILSLCIQIELARFLIYIKAYSSFSFIVHVYQVYRYFKYEII